MRVAVALVAGQAALCAVIGYVTFGPGPAGGTADRAGEARAPAVMPTASIGLPAAPMPAVPEPSPSRQTPRPKSHGRAADDVKAEPETKRTTRHADDRPETISAPDDGGDPAPEPPKPQPTEDAGDPQATPGGELTGPVKVGDECETEGDRGRTAAGDVVKCLANDAGDLRWQPA
ncbi:hypothetical protein Acsp02_70010 [Actinoplanes sp. NBRC 103695]|nr:hypothetical protein Acsp02_70010 [Actinoplanes sp. NBRC 103695]